MEISINHWNFNGNFHRYYLCCCSLALKFLKLSLACVSLKIHYFLRCSLNLSKSSQGKEFEFLLLPPWRLPCRCQAQWALCDLGAWCDKGGVHWQAPPCEAQEPALAHQEHLFVQLHSQDFRPERKTWLGIDRCTLTNLKARANNI